VPLQKLQFRPGVNREGTTLANEGGWFECDKVRFRSGYPEKIGGWAVISYATFLGTCRSLWNWITLKGYNILGVGTHLKFYVENGGVYYDITPIAVAPTLTNPFNTAYSTLNGGITATATTITLTSATSFPITGGRIKIDSEEMIYATTSGSTLVQVTRGVNGTTAAAHNTGAAVGSATLTVTDASHVVETNSFVNYTGVATFDVFTSAVMNSNAETHIPSFQMTYVSGTTYTITVSNQTTGQYIYSTALVTGGGGAAVVASYELDAGLENYSIGTGWGAGPWPPYSVVTLTNPFTAASIGATTLNVNQPTHGLVTGDSVFFYSIASNPCGINKAVLLKGFNITRVDANNYTISTNINGTPFIYPAASTAASGGAVVVEYPTVTNTASYARGWGEGYAGASTGIGLQLRLWNQANFGEVLLFSPRGGAIYYWEPGAAGTPDFATRGAVVTGSQVPVQTNQIMVSDATRICIAFGATSYSFDTPASTFDPMLIRWSVQEDYANWSPSITNQAGSYRLSHGSFLVGALQTRQEILVWTDSTVYSMQYLGPPYIWGFNLLSDNISIISPNAMATANGVTYWMGTDKFYIYSGRVETLPCSLRQYVFDDINKDQSFQCFAGTNEGYSEVWWFYCSTDATSVDRYVIFNYLDRVWYYGTMDRSAWLDSPLRQFPQAATLNNLMVFHEAAVDDGTTNPPTPIESFIQSSDFDIGDGHNYGFVWQIVPDITFDGSNTASPGFPSVNFTVRPRQNPGANYGTADNPAVTSAVSYATRGTYNVQQFTQLVNTRIRGRQMAFKIQCDTLGTQWQLGTPRINVRPDGRR
jgi:hypothetical protein